MNQPAAYRTKNNDQVDMTLGMVCKRFTTSSVLSQAGGALIGPHALGIIQDVEGVRHLAELGVVFLLFNIGLELSLERLRSMQKYVFGMGTAQVETPCRPYRLN